MAYERSVGLEIICMNKITTIPPPTSFSTSDIKKDIESCTVCFFDLETTGLSDTGIAGSKDTGITKLSGKLYSHGKLFDAVEVKVGLNRFGLWLKELCGRVVLVGHNVWVFDVKHFLNNVKNSI